MRLRIESLESRHCLSTVVFESHQLSLQARGAALAAVADIDTDGDQDILMATQAGIRWNENLGNGEFRQIELLDSIEFAYAASIQIADIDADGDVDIFPISGYGLRTAWFENVDGRGEFSKVADLESFGSNIKTAFGDLDGNGTTDILITGRSCRQHDVCTTLIGWYDTSLPTAIENLNVVTAVPDLHAVDLADLNGDGKLDIITGSNGCDLKSGTCQFSVAWYENLGHGQFAAQKSAPERISILRRGRSEDTLVQAHDVDQDGDLDLVASSSDARTIAWFENTDGSGTLSNARLISTNELLLRPISIGDIDGDGDLDIVAATSVGNDVIWNENLDGHGNFGDRELIKRQNRTVQTILSDLDNDGDLDVVVKSEEFNFFHWYENQSPVRTIGDSNGDGIFDSSDLVAAFIAGD